MTLVNWLGVLSGLSLFLYGMINMTIYLEKITSGYFQYVLQKLVHHKFQAICLGVLLTSVLQSSSAMTVMLIGLVNARVIELRQAMWVIMGANIGTTMTGQLMALRVGMIAPLLAIVGVILICLHKYRYFGEVLEGLGMLFMGLDMMSSSLVGLQHSQWFHMLLTNFKNPLLCLEIGVFLTMIIQSSSASFGILQAFMLQGLIPFQKAVYLMLGFDIGTCTTALIASFSGSQQGKRLALFHLIFNCIGVSCFFFIFQCEPLLLFFQHLTPSEPLRQIANMHTFFNVSTTMFVACFDSLIMNYIKKLVPIKK